MCVCVCMCEVLNIGSITGTRTAQDIGGRNGTGLNEAELFLLRRTNETKQKP